MKTLYAALGLSAAALLPWTEGRVLGATGATSKPVAASAEKTRYAKLATELDIYAPPRDATKLLKRQELFALIASRGLPIKLAREDLKTAEESLSNYKASRRPRAGIQSGHNITQVSSPDASTPGDDSYSRSQAFNVGIGVTGQALPGVNYTLNLPQVSRTWTDPLAVGVDNPQPVTAKIGGSVALSLLKGSVFVLDDAPAKSASLDQQVAREGFKSSTLQAMLAAEQAFYDVIQKQIRLRISERSVESAKALKDDVLEMVKAGESDQLSLLKVDLQLAQAEVDMLAAQTEYAASREALRELLALTGDETKGLFPDASEITTVPELPKLSLTAALEQARKDRPDFRSLKLRLKKAQLDARTAASNRLPQLDLSVGYDSSGISSGFGGAVTDAAKLEQRQLTMGLTLSYVFYNNDDIKAARQANITAMKTQYELDKLSNQISKEIASLLQRIDMGYRKLRISSLGRELSEKKLNAEYEKFRVGESSLRNIIDYQNEVNGSRITEMNSKIEVFLVLNQFRAALGELPAGVEYQFGA